MMNAPTQLAKHLREVYFGGNWTSVNLKDTLTDMTWQQATTQVHSLNTIATLVHHMNYYVSVVSKVLQGGPLEGKDTDSFIYPPIQSQEAWEKVLDRIWTDAEHFAQLIEQLPEARLWEDFTDKKYGNYYRHLLGFIEHTHYHLGQIVVIKKMISQAGEN